MSGGRAGLLLVGAALLLLLGTWPAAAQFNIGGSKQNKNAPVVFQADEVQYDEQLGLTVAKGHVEISQAGEILLADTVSYNQRTDTGKHNGQFSSHRIHLFFPSTAAFSSARAPERAPYMPTLPSWQAYSNTRPWLFVTGISTVQGHLVLT